MYYFSNKWFKSTGILMFIVLFKDGNGNCTILARTWRTYSTSP